MMKSISFFILLISVTIQTVAQDSGNSHILQIVFTSDAHYGITRSKFRGDTDVNAHIVNAAMIQKINSLPALVLPHDSGVDAGKITGAVDYVIEGGDIANRMEIPNPTAAADWRQFDFDYIHGITLRNHQGKPSQLFIIPGNHDITNAIGFYRPMKPLTDPSSMVNIYNLMLHPAVAKTNAGYNYKTDRINYSKNIDGIHFMFITLWPDSLERIWMEKDLRTISPTMPVVLFTHDEEVSEAKHFTNPNGDHSINADDKFEDLSAEAYKDSSKARPDGGVTIMEQIGWANFLTRHPNIKAYFHGNTNYNEFYVYRAPDNNVALNTFRVDSPMKGEYSGKDETKLSFQLITIDTKSLKMTVRECLWNTDPLHPDKPLQWGSSITVSL